VGAKPDWVNARAVLEYLFESEQRSHEETATDLLALADARLHTGDMDGALAALRRMTSLEGDVYANYDMAAAELERAAEPGAAVEFLTTLATNVPWDASFRLRLAEAQMKSGREAASAIAGLRTIAASSQAPYEMRVRAARDLAAAGNPPSPANPGLGSAELNLIAASSRDVQAARQPYFVAARVAVAGSVQGAAARADVLLEALAIAPDGPDAQQLRLGIFAAEFDAGNDAFAAAAIEPVAGTALNVGAQPGSAPPMIERAGAAPVGPAQLADQIATVYQRLGRDPEAAQYLASAIAWQTDANLRAALETRRKRILDAQALEAANAMRRPLVAKDLDQSNLVRPRLTAAQLTQTQLTQTQVTP
jgi:hypothetical protein